MNVHNDILFHLFGAIALCFAAFQVPDIGSVSKAVRDIGFPAAVALAILWGAFIIGRRLLRMAENISATFLSDMAEHIKLESAERKAIIAELKAVVLNNTVMLSRTEGILDEVNKTILQCRLKQP